MNKILLCRHRYNCATVYFLVWHEAMLAWVLQTRRLRRLLTAHRQGHHVRMLFVGTKQYHLHAPATLKIGVKKVHSQPKKKPCFWMGCNFFRPKSKKKIISWWEDKNPIEERENILLQDEEKKKLSEKKNALWIYGHDRFQNIRSFTNSNAGIMRKQYIFFFIFKKTYFS